MTSASRAIGAAVEAHLEAIDDLIGGLQAATAPYRDRSLDWGDVVSLSRVREQLSGAVQSFSSAVAAAELSRSARQVATEMRRMG